MVNEVAVTGLGAVCGLGHDVQQIWAALKRGEKAPRMITKFDASDFNTQIAGEVRDFELSNEFGHRLSKEFGVKPHHLDTFSKYVLKAAEEAYNSANPHGTTPMTLYYDKLRLMSIIGSGYGGITLLQEEVQRYIKNLEQQAEKEKKLHEEIEKGEKPADATIGERAKAAKRISPTLIPNTIINAPAAYAAMMLGFHGPSFAPVSACSSGMDALIIAYEKIMLRPERYGAAIFGATEAAVTEIGIGGFANMKATTWEFNSKEMAEYGSRPFDEKRSGFVMGEGCGVAILENMADARGRTAPILGKIIGIGDTSDGGHITQPNLDAVYLTEAIRLAIEDAGLRPSEIADKLYISYHGTSTPLNDPTETLAVKNVFGQDAYKILGSSTKGSTGHLLGAAGALEFVLMVNALVTGWLPPTANLEKPEEGCDLNYIPNQGVQAKGIRYGLKISAGFGGHNKVALFELDNDIYERNQKTFEKA